MLDRTELIASLKNLHPELQWGEYPLGDYEQVAELGAPDTLICFCDQESDLLEGCVDPYSTFFGEPCVPSHWDLSEKAAQAVQQHNQVFITRYPNNDGPRSRLQPA